MLSFTNRFHGHASLKYVYRKGQTVRSRLLTVKSVKNTRRNTPRVAVVVSKKICKSAVGRNRMRRRLYELLRRELPTIKPNYDIVVLIFSRDVETIDHSELRHTLRQNLTQAGLYK